MNIVLIVTAVAISVAVCCALCVLIYKAYMKYVADPKRQIAVRHHQQESAVVVQVESSV